VHVPSIHHGPDGLSRRLPQQDDVLPANDDDDFEDWVDRMHGFLHIINDIRPVYSPNNNALTTLIQSDLSAQRQNFIQDEPEGPCESYEDIPRSIQAQKEDDKIKAIFQWHSDLKRPSSLSDEQYSRFMRQCAHYFRNNDKLWRKDEHGEHK